MLSIALPASELLALLRQDSVLWVERAQLPRIANDRAQAVTGVAAARQRFDWLDGSGQIVAVTDTGLDVQAQVQVDGNPDFAASWIVAAYTPAQMNPADGACQAVTDWSDRYGHGTHVAGNVVGAGARSPAGVSYAGAAPAARLVVQSVSLGGTDLEYLPAAGCGRAMLASVGRLAQVNGQLLLRHRSSAGYHRLPQNEKSSSTGIRRSAPVGQAFTQARSS